jgi:uncharacterized protein YndB with AHSA1/START domain
MDINLEETYPFPPESLWRALTDRRILSRWLMTTDDFEPRVGQKFQFRAEPQWGWRGVVDSEVLKVEEPRLLSYTWQGEPEHPVTVVTWTIEPLASGARLHLEHKGFSGATGLINYPILRSGWGKMLDKLRTLNELVT